MDTMNVYDKTGDAIRASKSPHIVEISFEVTILEVCYRAF